MISTKIKKSLEGGDAKEAVLMLADEIDEIRKKLIEIYTDETELMTRIHDLNKKCLRR